MLVELSPGAGSVDRSAPRLGNGQLWLIAALALLPHLGGLGAGFVYDDFRFVTENPGVHTLSAPHELLHPERASQPVDRDIWRPLRTVGFAVQHAIFGNSAWGYHAVSLIGLLLLVRAFLAWISTLPGIGRTGQCFAGLLFGVHPLTVECVAWISSQGDLGAGVFTFLALALCDRRAAVAVLCGVLAWLSKESAIPLVAVMALGIWPLARLRPTPSHRLRVCVLLAIGTVLYLVIRQSVLDRGIGTGADGIGQLDADLGDRILTACQNLNVGLHRFMWPHPLSVDYGFGYLPPLTLLDAGIAVVTIGVLVWLSRGTSDAAATRRLGLLAALLFFLPTCGLLAPIKGQMAERFLLLPVACLCVVVGSFVPDRTSRLVQGILLIVLVGLGTRTAVRTHDWRDQRSLFAAELRIHPESVQAHIALATESLATGDFAQATDHFQKVIEGTVPPDPKRLGALYSLGAMAYESGARDTAWSWMQLCRGELEAHDPASLDPILGRVFVVLGNLARSREGAAASAQLAREGLTRFGRQPALLETLAIALDMQGDPVGAERLYQEALAGGAERNAAFCYHMALALVHQGRTDDARRWLREALGQDPAHGRSLALLQQIGQ